MRFQCLIPDFSLSTPFSLAVEEVKTESDAVDGMEVSMPPKGIFLFLYLYLYRILIVIFRLLYCIN